MKNRTIKSVLFASLILLSISCFVYVNTASIDRALSVEMTTHSTKTDDVQVEKDSQMPDLAFVKGVVTILQKFLPAK
jgi:hypothetical protein